MHGEVVDGGAAGFGDVFRARAGLGVEEYRDIADLDFFFGADLDDTVTGGNRGNDGIKFAVDANFGAFRGHAGPAVGVADRNGGDPHVVLGHVRAVVAGAVPFAQFFGIDDASFEADGRAKIEDVGVTKFVFGIDAVDGHAGTNHVEERVGMLKEAEAGGGVLFAEGDGFFFECGAGFVEAPELLFVEVGIFGEGHHGALDADGFAGGEIAHERGGLVIRHADTADAGVDADVERDGLVACGGDVDDAHAVAVVLDDGENRTRGNAAGDFGNVVTKIFAMDFDPGIERRVLRGSSRRRLRGGELRRGTEYRRQGKTGFEEQAA